MKKLFISIVFGMVFSSVNIFAGTLIYKINNQEKIISDVEIISLDNKFLTIEIDSGKERLPLSQVVKFYDTDINAGGVFDDSSNNYKIFIRDINYPSSKTGYVGSKKKRETSKIEVKYDIIIDNKTPNTKEKFKKPYFYLFVLTTNSNDSNREIFTFYSPNEAKCNFKHYDEALMMEKALSSKRDVRLLNIGRVAPTSITSEQKVQFELRGVRDRKIIATHLIVWGKDSIIYDKTDILDHSRSIGKYWYTNPK